MRQYNMLQSLWMSFYSRDLYKDVATNWGGRAYLYLLLLIALSCGFFTYNVQRYINHRYPHFSQYFVAQMPLVTVKDGILSTPENRPYFIRDENKEIFAVIDTSGKYQTPAAAKAPILVTRDSIMRYNEKNQETNIREIPKSSTTTTINPAVVNQTIQHYLNYAWLAIFPVMVALYYIYRLFQLLFYSVIGFIYSRMIGLRLSFSQIMRIAIFALTPPIVLAIVANLLHFHIMFPNLFAFVLAIFYMCYGISANRH